MSDSILATYGDRHRVITRPPAREYGNTVFVQELRGAEWQDVCSYNTLSDDYAYSNARDTAKRLSQRSPQEIVRD